MDYGAGKGCDAMLIGAECRLRHKRKFPVAMGMGRFGLVLLANRLV